ncbi:hypothetical protein AJ88_39600 [Mesorhizobium amorphae CCBAU 01583]|nr:hypothetical protein AJ88_39600 [Mesorhizobium amorphae CCBAU 01583]
MVSGWWRAKSGFWTMVLTAEHRAEPKTSSAPVLKCRPCPSPMAMMPMPAKEIAVPSQAMPEKRSPSSAMAMMAVKIGLTLMMKPAAPAETVSSPKLSIAV